MFMRNKKFYFLKWKHLVLIPDLNDYYYHIYSFFNSNTNCLLQFSLSQKLPEIQLSVLDRDVLSLSKTKPVIRLKNSVLFE